MQVETRLVYTIVSTALLIAFILLMQRFVGSRLREIDGWRGVIKEISLTRTRVMNDECLMIVPNRNFRESVVLVIKKKVGPKIP